MKHTGPSHNAAPGLPAAAQALAEESPAGLSVRGVTVTYRNGHTALPVSYTHLTLPTSDLV